MAFALLGAAMAVSLALGARALTLPEIWASLLGANGSAQTSATIMDMRLMRSLTGILTGASLAAAGLVMQHLTRNPLADPGILGVNAGAALAVVLAIWLLGWTHPVNLSAIAVCGAGLAAISVFLLGRGGKAGDRAGILRLTLAGVAVSALCLAFVSAIVLLDQDTRNLYRFWTIGSLSGGDHDRLFWLWPLVASGLIIAALLARRVDALALGTDTARSFGVSAELTASLALVSVALLAGGSVALAGPIGFVGLIVPHLTRHLVGPSILPGLAIACPMGGTLLLICDSIGRIVARPAEIQTGIILALIGGPAFLALIGRAAR
ncbi:FecCD family ABC transporter permease [Paracoccus saliphilus]|uniref:Iron ABC transporter permease n=1 Tax=Paracoccus saliphilus TaxID=405559 RepID=A0AA46A6K4_9RHOB|nr:iron ABC transporter permease [Paracoccus saliphilus]WCR01523.1 iron ABC transporter permease [Paracoccus saliphilus]SIS99277.1 iron complex transport system permease protein [Paracoccus saliphilus]